MKRITFTAYLTCTEECYIDVADLIGNMLSLHFGGATISKQRGYWADDGQEFKVSYQGAVSIETVAAIHLQVLPESEKHAITILRQSALMAIKEFALDARHLHIEYHYSQALHTDLLDYK